MIVNLSNVASIAEKVTKTKKQIILFVLHFRKASKYLGNMQEKASWN